jgi:ribosomal protein S18 acetylase RimI-like enzyme
VTRGILSPEVRLAEPVDLAQIAQFLIPLGGDLFGERFPDGTAHDFYRWKYFGNPLSDSIVGVATAGTEVVSVVAATAKRIRLAGKTVLSYELGDLLTDNAYRGMGLFSKLVELVCSEARERGSALVYVRPNNKALPILTGKLRFQEAQRIETRRWIIPSRVVARETCILAF